MPAARSVMGYRCTEGPEGADQHAQGRYQGDDLHEAPEGEEQAANHVGDDEPLVEYRSLQVLPQW